ncbi:MAG: S8 family serine peptidase [Planctomycetes bacterium]|nr:S8 family serine peptidase [Planctomycetota bacterium]MCB9871547.1 S8 family serine peptidase [Planctomycetota bacterium]MCB9889446.1 S8 family serine peptidase [Planctomycetota bacterium]
MRHLAIPASILTLGLLAPLSAQQDRLDSGLDPAAPATPVFVRLVDQVLPAGPDFAAFCRKHADAKRRTLRVEVVTALRQKSAAGQRRLAKLLESLGDGVRDVQPYWIVNGFGCMATGKACQALAQHEAVAFVYRKPPRVPALHHIPPRRKASMEELKPLAERALAELAAAEKQPFPALDTLTPTWNLTRIKADAAWRTGALGNGVTVAIMDSGLLPVAPLLQALWRNPKEKLDGKDDDGDGFVDDLFGYDFVRDTGISIGDAPTSHGTMCAGIIAGRPTKVGDKLMVTGIAPQARLMVLRGMGVLRAYEYALAHDADVVSMSYMWVGIELGNWRGIYRLAHEHLAIAGVVSVGGAGNFGPGSRRRAPPGKQICLPKDIPCVIAAAGLDKRDKLPGFSSQGPCSWKGVRFYDDYGPDQPLLKPDVTAFATGYPVWNGIGKSRPPGWRVVHDAGNRLGLVVGPQGNSFSGPHAAGVAALMLSANPDLLAWQVKERMENTCKDLGEKGRDAKYGAGLLDAAAAVQAARGPAK